MCLLAHRVVMHSTERLRLYRVLLFTGPSMDPASLSRAAIVTHGSSLDASVRAGAVRLLCFLALDRGVAHSCVHLLFSCFC